MTIQTKPVCNSRFPVTGRFKLVKIREMAFPACDPVREVFASRPGNETNSLCAGSFEKWKKAKTSFT